MEGASETASRRVGESVGGPDDEVLEDVSRVEAPKVLGNILGTPALSLTGRGGLGGKKQTRYHLLLCHNGELEVTRRSPSLFPRSCKLLFVVGFDPIPGELRRYRHRQRIGLKRRGSGVLQPAEAGSRQPGCSASKSVCPGLFQVTSHSLYHRFVLV